MSEEVMRALGRIEGKQEGMVAELQRLSELLVAQNGRVTKLEHRRERQIGWMAGISAATSAVMLIVRELFAR